MRQIFQLLIATACFLHLPAMSAEIWVAKSGAAVAIRVDGPIRAGDAVQFATKLRSLGISRLPVSTAPSYPRAAVVINSPGGTVRDAMQIGRAIRANKLQVVVRPDGECLSSCVYVIAAGVIKLPLGKVGIHRPYFSDIPNQGVEVGLRETLAASKEYFAEMNIPPNLADEMFSIPPEDIHILDDAKLSFYRLNQDDMAYGEEASIRSARALGISRAEYGRRWALFQERLKACDRASDFYRCAHDLTEKAGLVPH